MSIATTVLFTALQHILECIAALPAWQLFISRFNISLGKTSSHKMHCYISCCYLQSSTSNYALKTALFSSTHSSSPIAGLPV